MKVFSNLAGKFSKIKMHNLFKILMMILKSLEAILNQIILKIFNNIVKID